MGRPPSNGAPAFRFSPNEVSEMETILQEHKIQMPSREVIVALAEKFSSSEERSGKITVQMKQVWNWFQNRRYALRAKGTKPTGKFSLSPLPRNESTAMRNVPQAPQFVTAPPVVQSGGKHVSDNAPMEFEAKSARDGAWYDVASFLSHRSLETGDPDVLVRFAGFGPEEDEWVNVRKYVRPRSLPCEASECVAVLPGDLILCFQEGKDQALYFDAHVLDSQRRRHDVRGCRCRFLVRYDHDQSEEIVPLRKVCRRPETDYRLQQLHAMNESGATNQQKTGAEPHHMGNTLRVYPPSEPMQKLQNTEEPISRGNLSVAVEDKAPQMRNSEVQKLQNAEPISHGNIPVAMEVEAPQTKIPEVQKPQNAGEPISHGHTPIVMEDKAPQTRNPEVQKLQKAEPFSHGVTPVAMEVEDLQTKNPEVQKTQNTEEPISHCDSPIAREVKAPQTRNPEVQKLHTAEETFSHGDTPVAMKVKDPQTKNPNVQKLQNTEPISHGDTPVATEVKAPQMENPEASAGVAVRTSMVPPSNEAVTSGATTNSNAGELSQNILEG